MVAMIWSGTEELFVGVTKRQVLCMSQRLLLSGLDPYCDEFLQAEDTIGRR